MPPQDYYETLGVARSDSEEDIRRAFRKKAMEYHPDRNKTPGAEDKFKEINEAYQVLSDSKKRAQYDRYGHAGANSNGGFNRPFDGFDVFGGFGDIFDSFFNDVGGVRAKQAQRGDDLQQRVSLSFEEAVFGAERNVEITRLERCKHCTGAGNEPGTEVTTCQSCRGKRSSAALSTQCLRPVLASDPVPQLPRRRERYPNPVQAVPGGRS